MRCLHRDSRVAGTGQYVLYSRVPATLLSREDNAPSVTIGVSFVFVVFTPMPMVMNSYSHPSGTGRLLPACELFSAVSTTAITRRACSGVTASSSPIRRWSATVR